MAEGTAAAVALGAGLGLLTSPWLAALVRTVPDPQARRWWRPVRTTRADYAATAALAAGLGALAGYAATWSATLPALLALAVLSPPLLLIDLRHHRLPDRLVMPAAGAALALLALAAAVDSSWPSWLRGLEAAAVVYAAGLLLVLATPRALGYGDVKLAAVLAGYLGWLGWVRVYQGILAGFVLTALAAVLLLVLRRATRHTALPFGPGLILGTFLVLAFTRR